MNLIANSGIQYFTIPLEINLNNSFKMYFHQWFDSKDEELKLEIAHLFSADEVWVKKYDLSELGYASNGVVTEIWGDIVKDFLNEGRNIIQTDSGCFQESLARLSLEKFENIWYPFPYFLFKNSSSSFGPTNWCRFKLQPIEVNGNLRKYSLLIAFDTKSVFEKDGFDDEDLNETPVFTNNFEREKKYALCNNEFKLLGFCSEAFNCGWVDKYLLKQYHNIDNINEYRGQKPKMTYLAQYIFLLRYIQQLNILPEITLFSNKNVQIGNVDLVIDIGNSRTCAVLFDEGDFTKTSPLELQDFSIPIYEGSLNKYKESFDMRIAFREADLGGTIGIKNSRQFVYPSLVRLGNEANYLIHKATNMNTGAEKTSTFSSPKRFLWDTKEQKQEWEFVQLEGEKSKPIYIEGISEHLNSDGTLNSDGNGGILTHYSRKALMTFAFLEIMAQAKMQINSYEQRKHWGNESLPRKIRKIIVTCPTGMSRVEQISLRKCAEDASIILERFFEETYKDTLDEKIARNKTQVIPSAKSLANNELRDEWIYDEATSAQFVFLYSEICVRYLKNVKDYFDFYGKHKSNYENYNKKIITIGSVDIGAGTTDVMIADYKYEDSNGQCALTPIPLFWESFYIAGDDLLKELVKQLVVEGKYSPIEKKMKALNYEPRHIIDKNKDFFGGNTGMSFRNRQLRSEFNLQVSVPIVSFFLELLKQDKVESQVLSFSEIFGKTSPTKSVLNHFQNHFGFDFENLQWQYERKIVAAIVEKTFDLLLGKISSLFSYYSCDIVLLSGRPTSLKTITDLLLKHYAISPNRLKSMNDYRVGHWYPEDKRYKFIDGNGKFINPKSIITTGAIIGHKAETGGINGFSLNLTELKEKLTPTTNFFGLLNDSLDYLITIISPIQNRATISISAFPNRIGVRQLDNNAYPSRPFYILDFNDFKIEDRVKGRIDDENNTNEIQVGIEIEKEKIKRNMPLKITIERDFSSDKEVLRIVEIIGNNGDTLNNNFISLNVQSMSEVENFWLDSGIFSHNIQ